MKLKFIILHCHHLGQYFHLKKTFPDTNIRICAAFLVELLKTSISFFHIIDVDKKKRQRKKNKMK